VVLDGQDKPIPDANVYALPEQDMRHPVASTTTDSAGKFSLHDLPAVVVYVYAYKESDWYPHTFARFFALPNDRSLVSVKVEAGQVVTGVTLKRAAKAARLKVNTTDENGSPLGGNFVFTREDQPGDYSMGTSPEESMLVPPVPFRLTVGAMGYEEWHYGGAKWQGREGLIALKSGQTLSLDVKLTRAKIGELYERLIQASETNTAAPEILEMARNDSTARDFLAEKLPSLIVDRLPPRDARTTSPVWANAVRLAGQLKIVEAVPALTQALSKPEMCGGYDIRGCGVMTFGTEARLDHDIVGRALADIGDPCVPVVAEILSKGGSAERRRAMWVLTKINSAAAQKAMRDHLPSESDPRLRELIQDVLHIAQ
jgi:hypothetical protein